MSTSNETKLFFERAKTALHETQDVLNLGYYDLAVSRGYYAMFYGACALLRSQQISPKTHSGIRSAFAQYFVKTGLIEPEYSRMLSNAFNLRLDSDYKPTVYTTLEEATDVFQEATRFVDRVATYLNQQGAI